MPRQSKFSRKPTDLQSYIYVLHVLYMLKFTILKTIKFNKYNKNYGIAVVTSTACHSVGKDQWLKERRF